MPANPTCTVCAAPTRLEFEDPSLRVFLCGACGHRFSEHQGVSSETGDYYVNTPTSAAFVSSLEGTRRRQARAISARVLTRTGAGVSWLDFGSGRGWFLEELRKKAPGVAVAAFDTSPISRSWLEKMGVPVYLPKGKEWWPEFSSLPAAPTVVSLLDVLEHFQDPLAALRRLRADLPSLQWMVIKVPAAEGVLFRLARALRGVAPGPYTQLFQKGTFPPHYQYFSGRSLRQLLGEAGLDLVYEWTDPDVDNLFQRISGSGLLGRLPGGRAAALCLRLFPGDSRIALVRVR